MTATVKQFTTDGWAGQTRTNYCGYINAGQQCRQSTRWQSALQSLDRVHNPI